MISVIALVALAIGFFFIQWDKKRRAQRRKQIQAKQEKLLQQLRARKD